MKQTLQGRFNLFNSLADGEVRIKGVAYDAVGNESSALTYVYSIDNTGPSKVENLAYESTSVTITLSWDNVSDEDIRYYRVERRNEDAHIRKYLTCTIRLAIISMI